MQPQKIALGQGDGLAISIGGGRLGICLFVFLGCGPRTCSGLFSGGVVKAASFGSFRCPCWDFLWSRSGASTQDA